MSATIIIIIINKGSNITLVLFFSNVYSKKTIFIIDKRNNPIAQINEE